MCSTDTESATLTITGMTTTHSRAKKGGEYGANGEWYEGGKFIATTERPKAQVKIRSARKVEVEPGMWVESAGESIYSAIKWDVRISNGIAATHSMSFRGSDGETPSAEYVAAKLDMIAKYNRGERWVG
jgi:hypothetical protein